MDPKIHPSQSLHYRAGKWETFGRGIFVETPVTLTVNGQNQLTFLCTPTELEAVAVGFLFTNIGYVIISSEITLEEKRPTAIPYKKLQPNSCITKSK